MKRDAPKPVNVRTLKRPVRRGLRGVLEAAQEHERRDPHGVYPAVRQELVPIALAAVILSFLALLVCSARGYLLLYGDAVAHLGIARRILDARYPGLAQLGGVWLPLPHLLMLPFVQKMAWWQNGLAGAWPSAAAYVAAVVGCYKLSRRLMAERWAFLAAAFFALNANLLYLSTTAMTEPLFLALLLWVVDTAIGVVEAMAAAKQAAAARAMIAAGVLIFLMVFTRYDGWILGAAIWLMIAFVLLRSEAGLRAKLLPAFAVFTVITVAGPLLWFGYNAKYQGDWLDFLRGPYSAAAIEKKTTPVGAKPYRGWHNPGWSLLFYTRTAQVLASAWETGFAVMVAALAGAWLLWKQRLHRVALLLWLPLPFYMYSVSWGHVPIFIPQLYPHSYYNARYGIELLPALAICMMLALSLAEKRLAAARPKIAGAFSTMMIVLVIVNLVAMVYWTPLVLKEAMVNSSTRIPFETAVARELRNVPAGVPIMMDTTDHIGAVQQAGIPLKQIVGPLDSFNYTKALSQPAQSAGILVSFAGDAVGKAIAEHPQGLAAISVLCSTGQPCARFYRSDVFLHGAK